MNLVFEDLENFRNLISCYDTLPSSIKRFHKSAMATLAMHHLAFHKKYKEEVPVINFQFKNNINLEHYIIPVGVGHHPNDWTGSDLSITKIHCPDKLNIFHYVNPKYLQDLQQGRAMIMFDQCLEGYQTTWLWQFFHDECQRYNVPPESIIYVTGNVIAEEQYTKWADQQKVLKRINVIPYTVFENDVLMMANHLDLIVDYKKNYQYKQNNLKDIKTFNCLQKRLRPHRIWFYKYLADANLLNVGEISMNPFNVGQSFFEGKMITEDEVNLYNRDLPKLINGKNNNEHSDNFYIRRITDDVFLKSWVSVISEAAAGESEETIFISEKMFKPIVCYHPFIVVSNQGYLEKLREMGYKTFDGYIDESYDKIKNVFDRYDAIITSIKKLDSIEDKLSWFKSLEPILIHNYETFIKNTEVPDSSFYKLNSCYKKYFKLENYA